MAAFCRRNQRHRPLEPTLAEQIEVQQGLGVWKFTAAPKRAVWPRGARINRKAGIFAGHKPAAGGSAGGGSGPSERLYCPARSAALAKRWPFCTRPRTSDLIKIGGKRGSLAQITALIQQHPQVSDAYVFVSTGRLPRLMALVCGQVAAHALKHHIAEHCDDVFVPRQIRFAPSYRAIQMAKSFTLTPWICGAA